MRFADIARRQLGMGEMSLRILLASKRAPDAPGRRPGGVQTWVSTMRDAFVQMGHSVMVADSQFETIDRAELGVFANWRHVERFADRCDRVIPICHGIVDDETPAPGSWFTSEEVRDHWRGSGPIIRQPIDLSWWAPGGHPERMIVRYAARGGLEWLPDLADLMGYEFTHASGMSHWNARQLLWRADCVIASGRCAVEAMACGAPVVVCDERHYQGPLMDADPFGAMHRNYSGRGGVAPDEESLRAAILRAMDRRHLFRAHAELHHDASAVARQILEAT